MSTPLRAPITPGHTCVIALRFRVARSQAPGLHTGALLSLPPASHSSFCHLPVCMLPLACIKPQPIFLLSLSHSPTYVHPPNVFPHQPISSQLVVTPACIPLNVCPPLPKCPLTCISPHQTISSSPYLSRLYTPGKGRILRQPQRFLAPNRYTLSPSHSVKL